MNYSDGVVGASCFQSGEVSVAVPPSTIVNAVDEAEFNIKAPRALVISSALTAIATASQGIIDVCKPNGQIVPVSLMILSVANSGERKSTVENVFLREIRAFQEERDLLYQKDLGKWRAQRMIWEERGKALLKEASRLRDEESDEGYDQFLEHQTKEPVMPRRFKMLYEDSTSEALFLGLYQNISSAGLISSEGGGVLAGRAFNDLAKQNALWSGDALVVDRVSVDSYKLVARLTTSLMVQEKLFSAYMVKHGEQSRGSGLWARFLACYPISTQGERLIIEGDVSWRSCEKFSARIREVLEESVPFLACPEKPRLVVRFSRQAARKWVEIFNEIESEIKPGGKYFGVGDHASKLADNIARVAALFSYFENGIGEISLGTLNSAMDLCFWYSDEFLRLFTPASPEEIDVRALQSFLQEKRNEGQRFVPKNSILQLARGRVRKVKYLNPAIEVLSGQGKISLRKFNRTMYVDLYPESAMENFSGRSIFAPYNSSI